MSETRSDELDAGGTATAALLVDSVRRRIFRFVRRARRPVTRDEIAASVRVSRNLAAFHLGRLVAAGLLSASHQQAAGAPRVGRRPKVYEAGPVEVHVDVPARQHALLAGVLLEALAAGAGTAVKAAARRGAELGRAARPGAGGRSGLAEVEAILEDLGFEPYEAAPAVLRLGNCPFQPLATDAPAVICGLNHGLLGGLVTGIGAEGLEAILAPRPGECCVEVRTAPGAAGGPEDGPAALPRDGVTRPPAS